MSPSAHFATTDRNLLFGVLAVQRDFISRDDLFAGMSAWMLARQKPLGQILLEQGKLDADKLRALEDLLAQHLQARAEEPSDSSDAPTGSFQAGSAPTPAGDEALESSVAHARSSTVDESTRAAFNGGGRGPATTVAADNHACRYRKLRFYHDGGMGKLFVAEDTELHREVALKELKPEYADDPNCRSRFVLEAEITGGLEHPSIVPIHGLGRYPGGRPYYAMRFLPGDNLAHAIKRHHGVSTEDGAGAKPSGDGSAAPAEAAERPLSLQQLLRRFIDVCNAVAYAHSRRVLHRDLKPANVMLGKFGETLLIDWGLAKVGITPEGNRRSSHDELAEPTLRPTSGSGVDATRAGLTLGTPGYMSPEQAAGHLGDLGPASDIYSLGVLLYVLLTGRKPFTGADQSETLARNTRGDFVPPRAVNSKTPPALDAITRKAMAYLSNDRYASALELAEDVEHWLNDEPVAAYPESWPARAARWARRHRTAVAAAGVFLLSAVIALAASTTLVWHEQKKTEEQRQIAEANFEQARNFAVDAMSIIEAHEAEIAQVPLLHRARKELLVRASHTFQQELDRDPEDLELRARAAQAFRFTANVHRLSDETAAAEPLYRDAVRLEESLADETAEGVVHRSRLAEVLRDQAKVQSNLGRLQEARDGLEKSIQLVESIPKPQGREKAFLRPLAAARLALAANQYQRGLLDPQGLLADAAKTAQQAARDFEALDQLFPGEGSHPYDKLLLAACINVLASAEREAGRIDAAVPLHKKAAAYLEELRKNRRQGLNNNDVMHFLALCRLAECRTWMKKPSSWRSAEINLGETIKTWEDLQKRFPDVPMYRDALGDAYRLRGEIRVGWTPVAGDILRQHAVAMFNASPFQCAYLSSRALRWTPLDRRAEGLADLEQSRRILEQRVQEFPDQPGPKGDLGRTYLALSRTATDHAQRDQWLSKARDALRKALAQSPDNAENQRSLLEAGGT